MKENLKRILRKVIHLEEMGEFIFPQDDETIADVVTSKDRNNKRKREHYCINQVSSRDQGNIEMEGERFFVWKRVVI